MEITNRRELSMAPSECLASERTFDRRNRVHRSSTPHNPLTFNIHPEFDADSLPLNEMFVVNHCICIKPESLAHYQECEGQGFGP
jgi:hypothetical protein